MHEDHPIGTSEDVMELFPALDGDVGVSLCYLDSAATSLVARSVIQAMSGFDTTCGGTVHRSLYRLAERATIAYEGVRSQVAHWLGLADETGVIFTHGTTDSLNMVAAGVRLGAGDRVLVTELEHHSNLVPWQRACARSGAQLDVVPVGHDGALEVAAFERMLSPDTRVAAFCHISNVLGSELPVAVLSRLAHAAGALVVVDAAQSASHRQLSPAELDCDLIAFSAHKVFGPTGVGVLAGSPQVLEQLEPSVFGGNMVDSVDIREARWASLPARLEAGTPPVTQVVGFGAALTLLGQLDPVKIGCHSAALAAGAREGLASLEGVRVLGPPTQTGSLVAFQVEGVHPHDVAQQLDRHGVAIRAGYLCAQPLLDACGWGGCVPRQLPGVQ